MNENLLMMPTPTEHFAGLRHGTRASWDISQLCLYGLPPTLYPAEQAPDEESVLVPLLGKSADEDGSTEPIIMVDRYDCRLLVDASELRANSSALPHNPQSTSSLEAFLDKERYRDLYDAADTDESDEDDSANIKKASGIPYIYTGTTDPSQSKVSSSIPPPFPQSPTFPSSQDLVSLCAQLMIMQRVAKYVTATGEQGLSKLLDHSRSQNDPTFFFLDPENDTHHELFQTMVLDIRNDSNAQKLQELVGHYGDNASDHDTEDEAGEADQLQTGCKDLLINAISNCMGKYGLVGDGEYARAVYSALKGNGLGCNILTHKDVKAALTLLVGESTLLSDTENDMATHQDNSQHHGDCATMDEDEISPWIGDSIPDKAAPRGDLAVVDIEKRTERLRKAKLLLERRRLETEAARIELEQKRQSALKLAEREKQKHNAAISVHKQIFMDDDE